MVPVPVPGPNKGVLSVDLSPVGWYRFEAPGLSSLVLFDMRELLLFDLELEVVLSKETEPALGVVSTAGFVGGEIFVRWNGSGSEGKMEGDIESDRLLGPSNSSSSSSTLSSSSFSFSSSFTGSLDDQLLVEASTNEGADCIFP